MIVGRSGYQRQGKGARSEESTGHRGNRWGRIPDRRFRSMVFEKLSDTGKNAQRRKKRLGIEIMPVLF